MQTGIPSRTKGAGLALAAAAILLAQAVTAWIATSAQAQSSLPDKPSRPTATSVSHDSVTISWADPGDSSITGYQVLRRNWATDGAGDFIVIDDDTGTTDTTYTGSTVSSETRYSYRVKARNAHGLSARSGYVRVDTPAEQGGTSVPSRPTGLTVDSVSHNSVTVSWDDPGDTSITGYQILRRNPDTDASGVFTTIDDDTGSAGTSYTDGAVEASTALHLPGEGAQLPGAQSPFRLRQGRHAGRSHPPADAAGYT